MAHFGVLAPPQREHLNPLLALASELTARGHAVTFFNIADAAPKIRRAGHRAWVVGRTTYPAGWLPTLADLPGHPSRPEALLSWSEEGIYLAERLADEYAEAIEQAGVEYLLVDQVDLLGAALAEYLDVPFITICTGLITHWEESLPPAFVAGDYATTPAARATHRQQFETLQRALAPVHELINAVRRRWDLPPYQPAADNLFPQSALATIAQQPRAFDFPRRTLPPNLHYAGPLHQPATAPAPVSAPLDGRPLVVYAAPAGSHPDHAHLLRAVAAACAPLAVQLLIATDAPAPPDVAHLPGQPQQVPAAALPALLPHAAVVVTPASLGAVLDCLRHAVPVVALPLAFDQPGVAARVRYTGVGEVVPLARADAPTLRRALQTVLVDAGYRLRAAAVQATLPAEGGPARAATLIETAIAPTVPRRARALAVV